MSEEYLDYGSIQYIGKSGVTRSCVRAMVTLLTSTYRPEKIIAVISPTDHFGSTKSVLFLVWNWFYPGITIIPDGFGTHGGEGGRGLSTVLGLIKFYKIPLLQVWIHDKAEFNKLAKGTLTEEMFSEIEEAYEYDWSFYPLPDVNIIKRGKQHFLEVKNITDGDLIFDVQLP